MIANIVIKEIEQSDCVPSLFAHFDRYQEVCRRWIKQDGQWNLQDASYINNWDDDKKKQIVGYLTRCIESGGYALGLYDENRLIGFASFRALVFGSANQYINLDMLHISNGFRGKGLGKRLFLEICGKVRQYGVKKMYISANSAEDSMAFYRKMGCIDAIEINQSLQESEPFDCQLEYDLFLAV